MCGMKSGAADSPFEDDEREEAPGADPSQESSEAAVDTNSSAQNDESAPLLTRRDSVKDERELMQFYLRTDVYDENTENRLKADAGDRLGDAPYAFDLREAVVEVGKQHLDEVVEELREMGY